MGQLQAPARQAKPGLQTLPQVPQFKGSLLTVTHLLPQVVWPVGQTQAPPTQACPEVHARLHAPQLVMSVLLFTHAEPQRVSPPAQDRAQLPFEHTSFDAHLLAQLPQFSGSACVLRQALLHCCFGGEQPHAPAMQLLPGPQVTPHTPQLFVSVVVSTQALPHFV